MKVLMINGSPRKGNTLLALEEMKSVFEKEGIEAEIVTVGDKSIRGCMACGACAKLGKCVYNDEVNVVSEKLSEADGVVIGSPVYYASMAGTLSAFLDRLFYSNSTNKTMKVGAAVVVARRGGTTATFDQINKYFTISGMPVVSGNYWNQVHGRAPGEAAEDKEGMQNLRRVAKNMSFLMKSIALGKEQFGAPDFDEERVMTNFIR